MTRERLFRGKRVDNDEWIEGYFLQLYRSERAFIVPKQFVQRGTLRMSGETPPKIISVEVFPKTVGEFTGLVDKYGKKIFEGNIIRYCDEDCYYYPEDCTEFFGKVVQECGAFGVGTQNELPLELKNWCSNDNFVSLWEIYWNLNCSDDRLPMIEVIGNIYDNKELLGNE